MCHGLLTVTEFDLALLLPLLHTTPGVTTQSLATACPSHGPTTASPRFGVVGTMHHGLVVYTKLPSYDMHAGAWHAAPSARRTMSSAPLV